MLQLLSKYYPVTGKIALFFVGVLFLNLITVSIVYGGVQLWTVWSCLFCGFMFGRWAERMMIVDYFVRDAKDVASIKEGLEIG